MSRSKAILLCSYRVSTCSPINANTECLPIRTSDRRYEDAVDSSCNRCCPRTSYHRDGGKENWGYFGTNEKAKAQAYKLEDDHSFTLFDGKHLRIHFADVTDLKPFDLDLSFSPASHEWLGTWSRSHETYNVALRRPEPKSGASPNPFVGDWMADPRNAYVAAGSLHIRQSSDGTLSAWLDRVIASTDRRNGEFLQVRTATASELDLERSGEPTGPAYRYHGSLSAEGQMLTGEWAENYGARLNAPDKFRKMPD